MSDDRLPPFDSQGAPPPPPPPPPSGAGGSGAWGPPAAPDEDADAPDRAPSRRSPAAPFSTEPAPVAEPLPEPPPPAFGGQRAGLFDATPREEAESAPSPFSATAPPPAAPSAPPPAQPPPPDIGQNLGPAPSGPFFHDPPTDGDGEGGRPQWLLPVVALVVLLLVGAAFLVVQGLGDDDADPPESAQTAPTDPTTASTDTSAPPSTEARPSSAAPEQTTTSTTTSTAVPAELRAAGVVHLRDQVPGPSADAAACEALAGATEVRVSDQGGELIASAPLTSTAQLDARPAGELTTVTCQLSYEVGLPAGTTTPFTFALVSSTGELHDLRIVPADQLGSGTGPFLGTVYVPG